MGKWQKYTIKKKKENWVNTMIGTYQWQCNADSSHNSELYRLQLFVAVDFLPSDPSGIWRAGSNIVAASLTWLGGIQGGHCCDQCLVRRSCVLSPWGPCFPSLIMLWMPGHPETQQDGAKERREWEGSFSVAQFLQGLLVCSESH